MLKLWANLSTTRLPTNPHQRTNVDVPMSKKPGPYRNQGLLLKKQKGQARSTQGSSGNKNNPPKQSGLTTTTIKTVIESKKAKKNCLHALSYIRENKPVYKIFFILEPMQQIDRLPGTGDRKDRIRFKKGTTKDLQMILVKLRPKIQIENATFSIRSCNWPTGNHQNNISTNPRCYLAAKSGVIHEDDQLCQKFSTTQILKLVKTRICPN